MGVLDRFFKRRKKDLTDVVLNETRDWMRSIATAYLLQDLNYILVKGYGEEFRFRGPLPEVKSEEVWLFCAVVKTILAEFITSRSVWRHCEAETLLKCEEVLYQWALQHGPAPEDFEQKANAIEEVAPLIKVFTRGNTDAGTANLTDASALRAWIKEHPGLGEKVINHLSYFLEDGLILTFLRERRSFYNICEDYPCFS